MKQRGIIADLNNDKNNNNKTKSRIGHPAFSRLYGKKNEKKRELTNY